jgi:hypothetical protein
MTPRKTPEVLAEQARRAELDRKQSYSPSGIAAAAGELPSQAANGDLNMPTKNDLFPSKYLKASDLGEPTVMTIATAPVETLKYKTKEEDKIVLHFRGTPKLLPLNFTNFDSVVAVTGEADTDNWPGKRIELFATTTEVQGRTVDCVRIRAPSSTPKKTKAKAEEPPPDPEAEPDEGATDDAIPF